MFEIIRSARLRALEIEAAVSAAEIKRLAQQLELVTAAAKDERKENKNLLHKIMLMKQQGYASAHGDGDAPSWGRYSMEEEEQKHLHQTRRRTEPLVDDPDLMAFENELRNETFQIED